MSTEISQRLIGAAFVFITLALHIIWMGWATSVLNLGLVVSYGLWATDEPSRNAEAAPLLPVYLPAIAIQCLHFGEEYLTGFQREFPNFFGYQWTDRQFVTFNLLWLTIFVLAALGVYYRIRLAYLVVWFCALVGGIGNGIGHLALTLVLRRYFPGAVTAPLCLLVGIALVNRLLERAPLRRREQPEK
jgi:hypothetical protein